MPNHRIILWKRNPYNLDSHEMELQAQSTRSSIRIILQPPEEYHPRSSRAILMSITRQNLWKHFGVTNSEYGYLASQIRSAYVTDIGYLDFLSEEEAGTSLQHAGVHTPKLFAFCEKVYNEAKERWGYCENCSLLGHDDDDTHTTCDGCQIESVAGTRRNVTVVTSEVLGDPVEVFRLCNSCGENPANMLHLLRCIHCSRWVAEDIIQHLTTGNDEGPGHQVCPGCHMAAVDCGRCGRQVSSRDLAPNDMCYTCVDALREEGTVRPWNFRPVFIFHPGRTQREGEFYIGLEIEVSFGSGDRWDARQQWVRDLPRDLVYCKNDSSVRNGWEVVTHPMQPKWALKYFPFEIFDELKGIGALETHDSCGTHAHINKDAFSSGHLWRFMQIHYRLPKFCQSAGGRSSTNFASFVDRAYLSQKTEIIHILKNKGEAQTAFGRNVALNFSNTKTIELRYMAGGSTQALVRKNLEWVKALLDYSAEITINQIRQGVLDDAGYFLGWIYDRKDELPNLCDWLARVLPTVHAMPERSN